MTMRNRITQYMAYIDEMLKADSKETDWQEEIRKHLIQLEFYKHERFVHLIVMVLFAIMSFSCVISCVDNPMFEKALMFAATMCLTVPYIIHYYFLENSVQYMYVQYDRMMEKAHGAGTCFAVKEKKK